jgi:cGMP-dependent protein kinase 2
LSCKCYRQDPAHLYMLFDLMPGGDLMDVLVAEAKVIKYPVEEEQMLPNGQKGLFTQKVRVLLGVFWAMFVLVKE